MGSIEERRERAGLILKELKRLFPDTGTELRFGSNWELLVAVVLSAQATDKQVNRVTGRLFRKYRSLDDYADADVRDFERDIREIGLFRSKASNIVAAARMVRDRFGGRLPRTMESMTSLPGVGRKSANIILSNAFGIVEGIAVDTHVRRLSIKLGLTDSRDPGRIERDLMQLFPKREWSGLNHRFVLYGRRVCPARRHDCREHPLTRIYPPAAERWFSPRKAT